MKNVLSPSNLDFVYVSQIALHHVYAHRSSVPMNFSFVIHICKGGLNRSSAFRDLLMD